MKPLKNEKKKLVLNEKSIQLLNKMHLKKLNGGIKPPTVQGLIATVKQF